jgi:hypothetical protein
MIPKNKKDKNKLTAGGWVFNILFVLASPVIMAFYALFNVLIWVFSLPSRLISYVMRLFK